MTKYSIAIVHDWLTTPGGSERVLESFVKGFPDADVFTLIYDKDNFSEFSFNTKKIHTAFLQYLPFSKKHHRYFIGLMPMAIERFDLSRYDLILSSSNVVAHGVLIQPGQIHINYIHSPMRFAYNIDEHLTYWGINNRIQVILAKQLLHRLRKWDQVVAKQVDCFIANSHWTAQNVQRAYGKQAEVVYPPVRVNYFQPAAMRENYFITVGRLVPYKRHDLIIEAFNRLGLKLIVVGNGPMEKKLKKIARSNIKFMTGVQDQQVANLLGKARAFVYAAIEDFGISVVEAQAAGCPVIAFGKGGVLETVIPEETGLFFQSQSVGAIVETILRFNQNVKLFRQNKIRNNALRFSEERFLKEINQTINTIYSKLKGV